MDSREVIMAPSSSGDGLLGGGGIGALLIGALLFGGGFGGNNHNGFNGGGYGGGYGGYPYPYPAPTVAAPVAVPYAVPAYGNGCGNGNGWSDAAKTDVVLNPAFQSLQHQISAVQTSVQQNGLMNSISDVERAVTTSGNEIHGSISDLSTAQANQNFTTLTSINDLGRDVQTSQNQAALQQLNSFNQLNTTTLQGFNNMQFQNAQGINQIIAQGTANAAANAANFCEISKEMATCCCELKQAIVNDGNLTRSLINDLNVQNLRDQLAIAQGKVSNNEQNQYLLQTILHHLAPTTVPIIA